ncbi:hypothetical protein HNY73_004741 [Argiope bruennichi]|uniref:Uncharacterized protein n=1 Tax=Argiope bruennichi TaxID=94029 RepID=A0A8T0FWQ7_ARGBR|nr:hypothetical protein HNY73_004741 [Argiope bruennichi]
MISENTDLLKAEVDSYEFHQCASISGGMCCRYMSQLFSQWSGAKRREISHTFKEKRCRFMREEISVKL